MDWQFDTSSFSFGNNSDTGYQNQFMPFDTVFKTGFPGIGLNQSQFEVFYSILTENLHRYSSKGPQVLRNESIIYVNSTCADLYDSVYDLGFNLTLYQVINYVIQLPLTALMRDMNSESGEPDCFFLVTALGQPLYDSLRVSTEYILVGDAFFQNFFA